MRGDANRDANSPARIRTGDRAIMSRGGGGQNRPSETQNADSDNGCDSSVRNRLPELLDDNRLRRVVEAWAELPEAVRIGIVAMVEASGADAGE